MDYSPLNSICGVPVRLDDDVDLVARALRQNHQEFVATEPNWNVASANRALEAARKFSQRRVSGEHGQACR